MSDTTSPNWTIEHTELLRKMWAEGATSSEIAVALGVTRNAVIGRARRLGLLNMRRKPETKSLVEKRPPPDASRRRSNGHIMVVVRVSQVAPTRRRCRIHLRCRQSGSKSSRKHSAALSWIWAGVGAAGRLVTRATKTIFSSVAE
jgi:hypothetical protein